MPEGEVKRKGAALAAAWERLWTGCEKARVPYEPKK